MAETFYFSHDYGARNDPKLVKLQMELGHEGKGIYWDLVEILFEQDGYLLQSELKSIAFALHTNYERMINVLTKYDLFKNDDVKYWSESVLRRIELRCEKSEKARESVRKRWEKYERITNELPTINECNTIKVNKVKEIKENKENESFDLFWNLYDNKTDRKKCFDKWCKLKPTEIEKIISTVKDFKAYKPFDKYTHPNPLTYLNGARWNDELPKQVEATKRPLPEGMSQAEYDYLTSTSY